MQAEGKGWLYDPNGLLDGPLPTHYEPQESVVKNLLYSQQCNPSRMEWRRKENPYHNAFEDPRFPYIITTYRLTEHHTAGGMTRRLSWLCELQPEMFCEISPELQKKKIYKMAIGLQLLHVRGEIEARVLVTNRLHHLTINGKIIHQIGLPYHWGAVGRITGDSTNELISFIADPNVSIQESKALTGNIKTGRRSKGKRAITTGKFQPELKREEKTERDLPNVHKNLKVNMES